MRLLLPPSLNAAVAEFGRLDILVNNVSVRKHGLITELSIEDWHAVQASILDDFSV